MTIVFYIAISIIVLILIGNFFTRVIQEIFIFRPIPLRKKYKFKFDQPFEELFLETPNRGKINALWFKRKEEKRPVVLYSHGNTSNLTNWADEHAYFDELGYDLFIWDYRGFGKSKGPRNEENFLLDARAMYDFVADHYETDDIVLYGRSMGTGVTSMLCSEKKAKLCILYTPYSSIPDLFKSYYPFLPLVLFRFKYNFYNNEWLEEAKCPVHIFHGTRDLIIPYKCAVKLKKVMKEPRNFHTIRGGKHNNIDKYAIYKDTMVKLLK